VITPHEIRTFGWPRAIVLCLVAAATLIIIGTAVAIAAPFKLFSCEQPQNGHPAMFRWGLALVGIGFIFSVAAFALVVVVARLWLVAMIAGVGIIVGAAVGVSGPVAGGYLTSGMLAAYSGIACVGAVVAGSGVWLRRRGRRAKIPQSLTRGKTAIAITLAIALALVANGVAVGLSFRYFCA